MNPWMLLGWALAIPAVLLAAIVVVGIALGLAGCAIVRVDQVRPDPED